MATRRCPTRERQRLRDQWRICKTSRSVSTDFRGIWFWPLMSSKEKGALFWQGTSGKSKWYQVSCAFSLTSGDKEISAHRQAHADHEVTHLLWVGLLCVVRPEPPSQEGTRPDKGYDRGGINRGSEQRPNSANSQNVAHTESREHSERYETYSGSEISTIHGEQ